MRYIRYYPARSCAPGANRRRWQNHHPRNPVIWLLCAALLLGWCSNAPARGLERDESVWKSLRQAHFSDKPIADGKQVIGLDAPYRAEDPAVVPITITDQLGANAKRRIDKVWLIIDNNPEPMSAIFDFGPAAAGATIATRVRVNSYTYMRVIARTGDGRLFMTKHYVKASGGCSAPIGRDLDKARENMGEMRLRELQATGEPQRHRVRLMIRHPNITGLQMDQLTRLVEPAHFVNAITVSKGNTRVFDSHMTFSLSANPSLQFSIDNQPSGKLSVRVQDNEDNVFTQQWALDAPAPGAGNGEPS